MSDDARTYQVVANHEEQYSIWPSHKEIPNGWVAVGPEGPKDTCLDYIESVWTDMRPRSLRLEMSDSTSNGAAESALDEDERADLATTVERVLTEYRGRVDRYADGHPELYGWFVARVIESMEGDAVTPDRVRQELNSRLPRVDLSSYS